MRRKIQIKKGRLGAPLFVLIFISSLPSVAFGKDSNAPPACIYQDGILGVSNYSFCTVKSFIDPEWTIAIFTVVLGIATWRLWLATDRLVEGSDATARSQLRAYVMVQHNYICSFDEEKYAEVRFQIENVGMTPANSMAHHSELFIAPFPIPDDFEIPTITSSLTSPVTVFPRQKFEGNGIASEIFNKTEIASIVSGEKSLYAVTEIFYDDIFGNAQTTNICSAILADKDTLKKLTSDYVKTDLKASFRAATKGNFGS